MKKSVVIFSLLLCASGVAVFMFLKNKNKSESVNTSNSSSEIQDEDNEDEEYDDDEVDSKIDLKALEGEYKYTPEGSNIPVVAVVKENDDLESVSISVSMSRSASESKKWEMVSKVDYDWRNKNYPSEIIRLVYSNCACSVHSYDISGKEDVQNIYTNGKGYFEFDHGGPSGNSSLKWTGASDDECKSYVFKKV